MNKKITIFAGFLIIVGIIGTISSSIAAVPFMTNYANDIIQEANREQVIYEEVLDINKLNINTKDINVQIKPSNSNKVIIKQSGKINNATFIMDNENKELKLSQKEIDPNFTIQGLGDFIVNTIELGANKITVYVPNSVDVQVKTESGSLILEDKNILLDKVSYSTNYGQIILPKEVKNLDSLNISSSGNINLKLIEILGIKDITVSTDGRFNIESMPDDIFIENIDNYIPNTFNIISSRYGANIDIYTSIPVANSLIIDNKGGYVEVVLPIENYNINYKLLASQEILTESENEGVDIYTPTTQFEGTFREPKENEKQYNVNIKSSTINLIK